MDNFVIGTIQENIKTLSNEIQVLNSNTPIKLSDLSDVSAVTPADGDTLVYNANYNIFEPKAQSGGSGGSSITKLDDIPNVNITGVQDNQFLKYSGGNWINSSTVTDTTYIQGIGVSIIDDTISIGQKVGTTDDVTFKSLVLDDSLELGDGVANATCKFTKVTVDMIDSEFKFRNVNENLLASISSVADGEGGNLRFYTINATSGSEVNQLTIKESGAIGLGNAENWGTPGQYLKSNGPSSAVSWGDVGVGSGDGTIALGIGAGQTTQGDYAVALGVFAGQTTQGGSAVAIGVNAGENTQGDYAIALGSGAGQTTQGNNAIALGISAGNNNQGIKSVAIGYNAGAAGQGDYSVAIGHEAGITYPGISSVAIGNKAGRNTQGDYAVAIGFGAGNSLQLDSAVAIGRAAGNTNQGDNSVAIGRAAGNTNQGDNSVAIGYNAGQTTQGNNAIALGMTAGKTGQLAAAVAIGELAGETTQGSSAVAIGVYAGQFTQGNDAIALGISAGNDNQGINSVAIGHEAGKTNQGINSVAIGHEAGAGGQGDYSVAIGYRANNSANYDNTVVINGSGGDLNPTQSDSTYITPIRSNTTNEVLYYDPVSGEVTRGEPPASSGEGGTDNLIELTDTEISTPQDNQVLKYLGGKWRNLEGGVTFNSLPYGSFALKDESPAQTFAASTPTPTKYDHVIIMNKMTLYDSNSDFITSDLVSETNQMQYFGVQTTTDYILRWAGILKGSNSMWAAMTLEDSSGVVVQKSVSFVVDRSSLVEGFATFQIMARLEAGQKYTIKIHSHTSPSDSAAWPHSQEESPWQFNLQVYAIGSGTEGAASGVPMPLYVELPSDNALSLDLTLAEITYPSVIINENIIGTVTGASTEVTVHPDIGLSTTIHGNVKLANSITWTQDFTIEIYFKGLSNPNDFNDVQNFNPIFSSYLVAGSGEQIIIDRNAATNGARFYMLIGNTLTGIQTNATTGPSIPGFNGEFGHLVLTHSSSNGRKMYSNGTLVSTEILGIESYNFQKDVQWAESYLGSAPYRGEYADSGVESIRTFRIYDRVLTASEIQALADDRDLHISTDVTNYTLVSGNADGTKTKWVTAPEGTFADVNISNQLNAPWIRCNTTVTNDEHGAALTVRGNYTQTAAEFQSNTHLAHYVQVFWNTVGHVGGIWTSAGGANFGLASDYRTKKDITPFVEGIEYIKRMKPITYKTSRFEDGVDYIGFLAHEIQEIHEPSVFGEKDAVDAKGNPKYQMVDLTKLVPINIAATQEIITIVKQQAQLISSLEARLEILESK